MARTFRSSRAWQRTRAMVLAQSDVCWLCGHPGANSVDHVVPVAVGGAPFDLGNLRPAHLRCNLVKGLGPGQPARTSRQW